MSLNWLEIDKILSEIELEGCRLKKIRQPDFFRVILEFARPDYSAALEIVLRAPFVRLNLLGSDRKLPPALPRPPRFTAVLKSRLEGLRLRSLSQLGTDRIVRFGFDSAGIELNLDAKLWGNAANIVLSDGNGIILDAFSRRPKRRESPGESWPPEGIGAVSGRSETSGTTAGDNISDQEYSLRDLPGRGSWNSRVERYYLALEKQAEQAERLRKWRAYLDRRDLALEQRRSLLGENRERFSGMLRSVHLGDIIMANLHRVSRGDPVLEAEDWESGGDLIRIPLNRTQSPQENAEAFYRKQKKAERSIERLEEDSRALEKSLRNLAILRGRLDSGDTDSHPFTEMPPEENRRKSGQGHHTPGLWIRRPPYTIAVGRNARESDWILRHWAKGNDTWLHVRDWPGGHVFIRTSAGKTIPLEILLDGGNLALSYSKAKNAAEADLYYTQVKNLRRPKKAALGTVLPNREKNLRVKLDSQRLRKLRDDAESG